MIEIVIGLITVIAGLFLKVKFDGHKIDNLKAKDAHHEKKEHIFDEMNKVEKVEEVKQDDALKNNDGADYMDRL